TRSESGRPRGSPRPEASWEARPRGRRARPRQRQKVRAGRSSPGARAPRIYWTGGFGGVSNLWLAGTTAVTPEEEALVGLGVGIFLIAVGAILAFAVHATTSGVNIHTVGWILMAV